MLALSGYQLLQPLDDEMTYTQNVYLSIIRGYFIYDMVNVLRDKKYIYIFHHFISISIMNFFEKYRLGKVFCQSLFLGELTNPLLQTWTYAKNTDKTTTLFRVSNHLFTGSFLLVRGLYMPYYFYKTLIDIYNNGEIESVDKSYIITVSILFNLGNFYWLKYLLGGYKKWLLG